MLPGPFRFTRWSDEAGNSPERCFAVDGKKRPSQSMSIGRAHRREKRIIAWSAEDLAPFSLIDKLDLRVGKSKPGQKFGNGTPFGRLGLKKLATGRRIVEEVFYGDGR